MIVVPANPNSVHVRRVGIGCCKWGFDSTYPVRLNGIITQDEYQQSIHTINKAFSSRKLSFISGLIFIILIIGGIALFIAGGFGVTSLKTRGFPVLVAVGLGIFFFGIVLFSVGCCIIRMRRATKMRQAIAVESMKYCSRSPTPTSWRLHTTRRWGGGYGRNRRTIIVYTLIIDIGNPAYSNGMNPSYQFNQMNPSAPPYTAQQNYMPPPSYNGQSSAHFCSQCGMTRQNPTVKFCSSCGQSFG